MSMIKSLLLLLLVQLSRPSPATDLSENELVILAMAPFKDKDPQTPDPSWYGGAALIPAARLAVQHINNRSDILPGFTLSLLEGNSGCNQVEKTLLNFTAQVFHHSLSQRIIGMVGPGCSESALILAPIISHPELNIMQVSIVTTPDIKIETFEGEPLLKFKNSFRTVGSSLVEVNAFHAIINISKWTKVGALYENGRRFHSSTFDAFKDITKGALSYMYSLALVESNLLEYVEGLKTNCIRVVFVFAAREIARKVICLAFLNNLMYPQYQFLFLERVMEDFTSSGVSISNDSRCSVEDMEQAMNGVIFVNKRNNTDSNETVAGIPYTKYLSLYEEQYNEYLSQFNIDRSSQVSDSAVNYFNGYYDAIWALALAVNKTASRFNLKEYRLAHAREINDDIRSNLEETHFEGMSGLIMFDEQRRDVPTIGAVITQLGNGTGYFIRGKNLMLNEYLQESLIEDAYITETQKIHYALGIVMLLVTLVMAILLLLLQVVFCKYSYVKEVKATSPTLNYLIFSGCYLFILLLAIFTILETFSSELANHPVAYGVSCSTMYWALALGYTLIFGTVSSKTWRIYRIFSHFKQGHVRFVSDEQLALFIAGLTLIDVVLLVAWNLEDPWQLSTHIVRKTDTKLIQRHECKCDNFVSWIAVLFAYKGLLTLLAVYLSILVRRVKRKAFRSTKKVIVLIYALVIVFFMGFTLYGVFLHIPIVSFLALSLTFVISVVMIATSLFLSNIWPVLVGETQNSSPEATSTITRKPYRKLNVPIIRVDQSQICPS